MEQEKEPDGFMAGIADGERFIFNAVTFLYPGTYGRGYAAALLRYGHGYEEGAYRPQCHRDGKRTTNSGAYGRISPSDILAECTGTGCKYSLPA